MKQQTSPSNNASIPTRYPILLFDGVCNLCNGAVQFIIKRDKKAHFRFAALQSEVGQDLLKKFAVKEEYLSTLVLIENEKAYVRSDAVLRVAKNLGGLWSLTYIFILVPRFIRNAVYNWVGSHRYQWFGQKDACMMPTPDLQKRFL